jgi:hypothetical protein
MDFKRALLVQSVWRSGDVLFIFAGIMFKPYIIAFKKIYQ